MPAEDGVVATSEEAGAKVAVAAVAEDTEVRNHTTHKLSRLPRCAFLG